MVCRDVRGGSHEVPQLTLATPEEKKLYEIGKGGHHRSICLPSCMVKPFERRVPGETTDRVKNGVDAGPSNVSRSRGTSFVLFESGPIRRRIHSLSFPSAGEGVDVGHPN